MPLRITLSLNENPFGPSPRALQAMREALPDVSRYAADDLALLKATIAAEEGVAPEQIVLGEVLNLFGLYLAASGAPGGEFVHSEPGYTALVDAVAPVGGKVVGVPLDRTLANDLSAIEQRANERTRAVYLVNPHNPTGLVAHKDQFLEFVRQLSRRTLVLVDEAYLDFLPDARERTAVNVLRAGGQVVVFRTFAKLHGLAGLGFGYALAPLGLAAAMSSLGIGAFFNLNRIGIAAATASLGDQDFIDRTRDLVKQEREAWHELFRRLGLRFTESVANFVFFDAGRPHSLVAAKLSDRGVAIGRPHPPLDNWIRISIGRPAENRTARSAITELLQS